MPGSPSTADANKAALITAVANGSTIVAARDTLGVSHDLYKYYRSSDPVFRRHMDDARVASAFQRNDGWQGDFATFRDTFFRHQYPTPSFHLDIIRKVESAPGLSVTMILVPPNHGKSTLLEDWVNYKLALDPNRRITLVSKSQQHARKMLGRIARRMTDPAIAPAYIARFGPFIDEEPRGRGLAKPWTRDYITVAQSNHDEADPSVQSIGWTGQIYGSRVDDLILDDIQTHDNLSQVDSMLDKLHGEFLNRGDEEFRAYIIGTRIEIGDIYEKLIDRGAITEGQLFVMPAIRPEGPKGDLVPLWPERWPIEKLEKVRKLVLEKKWWTNYMLKPQLGNAATFTDEMVDGCKDELRALGRGPGNTSNHGLPVVLSLDPALGGGNALTASCYDADNFHVLDIQCDYGLARTEDILARIDEFAMRYRPQDLVIEINAFQRGLARDERLEALERKYGFRTHEHQTQRNKLDPVMGVGSMAGSFLRRELSLPWADPVTQAKIEPLIKELTSWRPNTPTRLLIQDMVMSLWFGWLWWMQKKRLMRSDISDWKRTGVPGDLTVPTGWTRAGSGLLASR
jgi:hypothetical protein